MAFTPGLRRHRYCHHNPSKAPPFPKIPALPGVPSTFKLTPLLKLTPPLSYRNSARLRVHAPPDFRQLSSRHRPPTFRDSTSPRYPPSSSGFEEKWAETKTAIRDGRHYYTMVHSQVGARGLRQSIETGDALRDGSAGDASSAQTGSSSDANDSRDDNDGDEYCESGEDAESPQTAPSSKRKERDDTVEPDDGGSSPKRQRNGEAS
ncbi:hypothetical protein QBC34DRAFT_388001 [Podospora aff. communis PSN243]|uniref:Uncharacterized protein n=1 Tax=Podospora aff. communis PSN243 TaxID=3040156 RepID=A0AAV9H570_9PEZI|nr:hypothetical protein QBC34DRAFT_388001 [Podospora aff. communis PSN243]